MTLNERVGWGACNYLLLALGFEVAQKRGPAGWGAGRTLACRGKVRVSGTLPSLGEIKKLG